MKKKILAVIPARSGSKGIPRKNIKEICGKPLITYTIEAALACDYIDRVIISTNDKEIAEISKLSGGEVPFLRPDKLARDNSPTIDTVIDLLEKLKSSEGYEPDYIALLQCTSPLRNSKHLSVAIEELYESDKDGIISVCEAEPHPYWMSVIREGKLQMFIEDGREITRRQDLPKVYNLNGAIYIIKTDVLINERTFEAKNVGAYIMDKKDSVDIDEMLDFKIAELILEDKIK